MSAQPVEQIQPDPAIVAAVAQGVAAALPAALDTYLAANAFGIVTELEKAKKQIEKSKTFVGVVTGVQKEQSSTRGIITLHTGTTRATKGVPEGHEQVRTDRTDSGISGRALAIKAKSLIGHRVAVHVELEEFQNKQNETVKVRVLRHIEDLGIPN